MVTFGDGDVEPSHGSQGGGDGALNIIQIRRPGEPDWTTLATKDLVDDIPAGTLYYQISGGGGGWGDPKERPAEKVLEDVRNEKVSVESARRDYGVVIDSITGGVDQEGGQRMRSA
jgi:N-methylhydantoinase B